MQDEQLPLLVVVTPAHVQHKPNVCKYFCFFVGALLLIVAGFYGADEVWPFPAVPKHAADPKQSGLHVGPSFSIDLDSVRKGSELLWGSFFEEINHAGEGGLYAELIQDRSFDALVHVLGAEHNKPVTELPRTSTLSDNPMPWTVLHGSGKTSVTLVSQAPAISLHGISGDRRRAVKVSTSAQRGGLANSGFWGISLEAGRQYNLTLWAAAWDVNNDPNAANSPNCPSISARSWAIDVGLQTSVKGTASPLASASFLVTCQWTKFTAILTPTASAKEAFLTITTRQASDILLDHVSLMPLWTPQELADLTPVKQTGGPNAGTIQPWPFRHDLFMMLKNLKPRFLRFPGGCFVEGQRLATAEHWKNTVGPVESRPGHWDLWGYWSTDGLGLYEYMLLTEALGTEAVWVTNSGMAHEDQIPPSGLMPWIQEALDGLEFIMGPADSKWGALRAAMGHPEPFKLQYMAVGNEDAGMPFYSETYIMFWATLKSRYPQLKLIANDEIHPVGMLPNDLWDFHVYTDPMTLFNMSATFDNFDPKRSNVFVSEFAVTGDAGHGNVIAAVSEAAFMTGMERNADRIELASYAPLFVNTNDRKWNPDMIVFDGSAVYGTPSYWVGRLFSESYFPFLPSVTAFLPDGALVRASAVCTTATCSGVNVRVVNMYNFDVNVEVTLVTRGGFPEAQLSRHVLITGAPHAENSFDAPTNISPIAGAPGAVVCEFGRTCTVHAPGMSVSFLSFNVVTA